MGDKAIRGLRRRRAPTEQQRVGDQPPHARLLSAARVGHSRLRRGGLVPFTF